MEKEAKDKFLTQIATKYEKADRTERSTLLDQVVSKLKIHRKSAIRALRAFISPAPKKTATKSTKSTKATKAKKTVKAKSPAKKNKKSKK